ncbi:MAG: general secretion pathway protein GspA [Myxococcales bacterium FL481]|nr:MAG: general secretion pathway protein GspA [Myxococcales bacterium FL481]
MKTNLRDLYGLKHNPFSPDVPTDALYPGARLSEFCWRIEHGLAVEGGFAMISGPPGVGKSVTLRLLARQLDGLREVMTGAFQHPQSNIADFYREMGELFGVSLRPHNRWAGFKDLRARWIGHIEKTLMRPVLLVDEAQEMNSTVLGELRILASTRFDSRSILGVVLAGDERLPDKLRREELMPLGSRLRTRLVLEPVSPAELAELLVHRLKAAGNPGLMTQALIHTLCEHALGNPRVLMNMASELLIAAAHKERELLDEKLYFEVFDRTPSAAKAPRAPKKGRRAAAGRRR